MVASREAREIIQDILEKLLTSYAPQKVILFGSYAYGTPRQDSDIDLLIIKETSERFIDRWVTVRRILSDPERLERAWAGLADELRILPVIAS